MILDRIHSGERRFRKMRFSVVSKERKKYMPLGRIIRNRLQNLVFLTYSKPVSHQVLRLPECNPISDAPRALLKGIDVDCARNASETKKWLVSIFYNSPRTRPVSLSFHGNSTISKLSSNEQTLVGEQLKRGNLVKKEALGNI